MPEELTGVMLFDNLVSIPHRWFFIKIHPAISDPFHSHPVALAFRTLDKGKKPQQHKRAQYPQLYPLTCLFSFVSAIAFSPSVFTQNKIELPFQGLT